MFLKEGIFFEKGALRRVEIYVCYPKSVYPKTVIAFKTTHKR